MKQVAAVILSLLTLLLVFRPVQEVGVWPLGGSPSMQTVVDLTDEDLHEEPIQIPDEFLRPPER